MAAENEFGQMASAIVALCGVSQRGLVTAEQLWAAFDQLTVFMVRPEYSGMVLFTSTDGKTAGAVFSTVECMSSFVGRDCAWVSLPGADLWGLRVLPRFVMVDPGTDHALVIDTRSHPEVEVRDGGVRVTDIHETAPGRFGGTVEGVVS